MLFLQPLLIFGIGGLPNSWWDVLTLDLNLDDLLYEGTLRSLVSVIGTLLAFVRPTIPGASPMWLRQLFPAIAWFLFSDESTVRSRRNFDLKR